MWRGIVGLVVAVIGCSPAAFGQDWLRAPPGAVGERVRVGSAVIALPPGQWRLAGEEVRSASSSSGGPISNRLERKIFYQVGRGVLVAFVSINASVGYNAGGWITPRGCMRRDVFYSRNESEYSSAFDCLRINHSVMPRITDNTPQSFRSSAYRQMLQTAPLPDQMVTAEFDVLRSNRGEFVEVAVFVNPEASGMRAGRTAWASSPWHRDNLDPAHRAYLQQVVSWAEEYRSVVKAAWQ